ncbi:MAG: hypothetical protein WD059_09800 [Balneolaceae bacterium]
MQKFGIKKLPNPESWKDVVTEKNWKKGRSAYLTAHHWGSKNKIPKFITKVINDSKIDSLMGLKGQFCIVEKPTFLDTYKAPSFTDVFVYAINKNEDKVLLGVEAKVDESFGSVVKNWVNVKGERKPSRINRLEFLCEKLQLSATQTFDIRYQLLHRFAALIIESEKENSSTNILLIHSFGDNERKNLDDFKRFLTLFNVKEFGVNKIFGPILNINGRDFYTGWINQKTSQQHNKAN